MANEAVKVELTNSTGLPRRFTCASNASITKGEFLALTEPRTAVSMLPASLSTLCAGIAAMDKTGTNDDSTSITCWTDGIFDCVASGAITMGAKVIAMGGNKVASAAATTDIAGSPQKVIGYALEAADSGERVNIRVRL